MKLTEKNKDLEKVDEVLICPKVAPFSGLSDFLKTDDSQLYKFTTLYRAQLSTQALLYKMMRQLHLTDDSDLEEEEEEETYEYYYEPESDEETYENDLPQGSD